MEPFRCVEGIAVPLDRSNVDTDQIVPKQFLKRTGRTGYGDVLFYDWRYLPDGTPNPEFPLNQPQYEGAVVLITGRNFGCGSSREHAPWALRDFGFRAIIAPSFADIFRNNCLRNGLLPVQLTDDEVAALMVRSARGDGYQLRIDLEALEVTDKEGFRASFVVAPFWRRCLLEGLDEIGLTLTYKAEIEKYESTRQPWMPTVSRSV